MAERIYITTPLYYVNAEPHLGSTYTNVVCDAFARFHRQRGVDTFLLTGTDEHGEKIVEAAAAAARTPREFVDQVSATFRAVWDSVGIRYDHFMRTSDPHHVRFVQDVLARIHANGDIYFGSYSGLYCVGCERLYTEKEVNAVLKDANTFGDHVTLRRELINHRLMARKSDCSEYRKLAARPDDETRALLAAWRSRARGA